MTFKKIRRKDVHLQCLFITHMSVCLRLCVCQKRKGGRGRGNGMFGRSALKVIIASCSRR